MMPACITLAAITVSDQFNPLTGLMYILVFGGVLGMAYWTTRWVSKSYGRTYGTQIRIIDRLPIGTDRNFLMVRIGETHYFLYQDRNGVRLLDKLEAFTPEQLTQEEPTQAFRDIFEKIVKRKQG